jgi:hypothetical protein
MKITIHITFYYRLSDVPGNATGRNANNEARLNYLNRKIDAINTYDYETDIYIHCNTPVFTKDMIHENKKGKLHIYYHDLSNESRWNLPQKHRAAMETQKDDYDVFMYSEDDFLFRKESLEYWLEYKDKLNGLGYNLGFVQVEVSDTGEEYTANLAESPCGRINKRLDKILKIDGKIFAINDVNTYNGFWIYDKKEFHHFLTTPFWKITDWNPELWGPVERYTIGMNGNDQDHYKATLIPLTHENELDPRSKVYHMPNNYIGGDWKLFKFREVVEKNLLDCTGKKLVHKIIYVYGYRLPICEVEEA